MMKPFKIEDLGYFLPNEWSEPDGVLDQLLGEKFVSQTLWDDDTGMVAAILCFTCYWGKNWSGFFLISKNFTNKQALMLRKYVASTMIKLDADRLQTDSVAHDTLDKWHEFLGFELEGTRVRALYGKDYKMWARMREEA